eukprot:tig00000396_g24910.t1
MDVLPDALFGSVFNALGMPESWPLRAVCRRWRRMIEETEWANLELTSKPVGGDVDASGRGSSSSGDIDIVDAYSAVASLIEQGVVRLGKGASVALRPRLAYFGTASTAAKQSHQRTVQAACSLLETIMISRTYGPAQLREVTLELIGGRASFQGRRQ